MMPTIAVGGAVVDVAAFLMVGREGWVLELDAVSLAVVVLLQYAVVPYASGLITSLSDLHAAFPGDDAAPAVSGLDGASIARLPCFIVVRGMAGGGDEDVGITNTTTTITAECMVCLGDVEEGETVRALPCCRHAFHARCVDAWLRLRPTCPVCRATFR